MKKPRLAAIEYIRGISMLGVVGIHIGAAYLGQHTTPDAIANPHIVALLEIFTRFSVPIFFFISAFGLFYNLDLSQPFVYRDFLKRRYKAVVVPYVVWSLFYIVHYCVLWQDPGPLNPITILYDLFFGLANYQLYFMVLLIWFYLMMPMWVWAVKRLDNVKLVWLLVAQIAINYLLCFIWNPYTIENPILNRFAIYHLNYWVIHYVFIFLLGGYLAVHMNGFMEFMAKYRSGIVVFFWLTVAAHLGYYYYLLTVRGYTPLEGVATAHQLAPTGIIYTLGASLFFFTIFTLWQLPDFLRPVLALLGKHSYFMYLAHPLALTYFGFMFDGLGLRLTVPMTVLFYCLAVGATLLLAMLMRRLGEVIPVINKATIGVYPKK
ncbi:MAG: acyltransferase [Anaerovibrio sp.]|uniref:acyltransferase n=1 Tax=Anaerovibrio sp. TaxID=1872532 RepID=UPI0025B8CFA8|nr:acyltransferase [Anaerovibrio sp.]MBE6099940.1 acyltransferase [Anaerovibrio sp.]